LSGGSVVVEVRHAHQRRAGFQGQQEVGGVLVEGYDA